MSRLKVAILYGGFSSEREISLKTGKAVYQALSQDRNYIVELIDIRKNNFLQEILKLKRKRVDIVFIALHGKFGEDGKLQSLLDALNIKYTGSDAISSSIAMNKHYAKSIFVSNNIPTPNWIWINKKDNDNFSIKKMLKEKNICLPVIVKPCNEGSTIGVTVVENITALPKAIKSAFKYDKEIIVEQYILGKEITAPILGNKVLPLIEIQANLNKYYDYASKYKSGGSTHIIPPRIDKKMYKKIEELALKAVKVVGCEVVSRVDFIVDEKKRQPYVLEINTIPGMTEVSLLPESAKSCGISFLSMLKQIISLSLKKYL